MTDLKDVFGNALLDYNKFPNSQELITWTSITGEDPVPLSYFFKTYNQMPKIEQMALDMT